MALCPIAEPSCQEPRGSRKTAKGIGGNAGQPGRCFHTCKTAMARLAKQCIGTGCGSICPPARSWAQTLGRLFAETLYAGSERASVARHMSRSTWPRSQGAILATAKPASSPASSMAADSSLQRLAPSALRQLFLSDLASNGGGMSQTPATKRPRRARLHRLQRRALERKCRKTIGVAVLRCSAQHQAQWQATAKTASV